MPDSTFFPSLHGDDPGDNQETYSDISGQSLEPLNEPDSKTLSSQLSQVPGQDSFSEPEPEAPPADSPAPRPRRTIQDRIGQLTRRYRTAEGENESLGQEIQRLRGQLEEQTRIVQGLSRRPLSTQQSSQEDPLFQSAGETPPAGQLSIDAVRHVVQEAIAPFAQQLQERSVADRRRQAHEASFMEAAHEMPELQDANSPQRQAFNALYSSSPISQLEDAPYQIMLQVRGLLADEMREAPVTQARKRAAAVHTPAPQTTDTGVGEDRARYQKVLVEARKRLSSGQDNFDDYKAYRLAGRKSGLIRAQQVS